MSRIAEQLKNEVTVLEREKDALLRGGVPAFQYGFENIGEGFLAISKDLRTIYGHASGLMFSVRDIGHHIKHAVDALNAGSFNEAMKFLGAANVWIHAALNAGPLRGSGDFGKTAAAFLRTEAYLDEFLRNPNSQEMGDDTGGKEEITGPYLKLFCVDPSGVKRNGYLPLSDMDEASKKALTLATDMDSSVYAYRVILGTPHHHEDVSGVVYFGSLKTVTDARHDAPRDNALQKMQAAGIEYCAALIRGGVRRYTPVVSGDAVVSLTGKQRVAGRDFV